MKTSIDLYIPTYNRPDFLKRLLQYYKDNNVSFRIIIADSSTPQNKKINRDIVKSFSVLNIVYDGSYLPAQVSHHKFGLMLKNSKSKYTVFCADDDFIIPKGIEEAALFLDKNSDYNCAHGVYISFYINKKIPFISKFLWRYIYPYESISDKNPEQRLRSHILNYYQVLYAVRRTEFVKKAYKEFAKSKADPILFGELTPDMLTLIFGKMKKLKVFYGARQSFSTSYSYWPSLQDAIKEGIFEEKFSNFKKCLLDNFPKSNAQKIAHIIDESFEKYLKNNFQEHFMGRVNLFLKKLPPQIGDLIRQLHVIYLYSKENKNNIGDISGLRSNYYKDFEMIKKYSQYV